MSNIVNDNDDEDDYMSDTFLQQFSENQSSLLFSHKEQYKHKLFKKRVETQQKSKKELTQIEIEKRNEALDKPITSGNKGFILLEKMMINNSKDYNNKNSEKKNLTALMEERKPLQIDFKSDRKGFGHEKLVRKRKDFDDNLIKISEEDFIKNKRSKSHSFYTKKDLFSCQRSCYTLDQENGLLEPKEQWFWPPELFTKQDNDIIEEFFEDDDDDERNSKEQEADHYNRLVDLVEYLRQEYFYCNWCGVRYESIEDLEKNCPGNTRENHTD